MVQPSARARRHDPGLVTAARSLLRPAVLALVGAALLACSAPQPVYRIAVGQEGAPGVRKPLLLPLNVTVAMPTEVADAADEVFEQIGTYVTEQQREVSTISVLNANRLWARSIAEVEASDTAAKNYESAMGVMARRLAEKVDCDAIFVPDLLLRDARLSRRTVEWDGVRQRFPVVNAGSRPAGAANPRGDHDEMYIDDYAFTNAGDLDACNGMVVDGQYGYYVTDAYPWVLGCFAGKPDGSFTK